MARSWFCPQQLQLPRCIGARRVTAGMPFLKALRTSGTFGSKPVPEMYISTCREDLSCPPRQSGVHGSSAACRRHKTLPNSPAASDSATQAASAPPAPPPCQTLATHAAAGRLFYLSARWPHLQAKPSSWAPGCHSVLQRCCETCCRTGRYTWPAADALWQTESKQRKPARPAHLATICHVWVSLHPTGSTR